METLEDSPFSPQDIGRLVDNIRATDVDVRLASFRSITAISKALGPQRTREELIPYLTDTIDDEDEPMAELALQLKDMIPLVGGPEHLHYLLPALQELASSEENIVRDRAADGLNAVAKLLSPEDLYDKYIPLVDQLTSAHWFSQRATACALYPTLYSVVTDESFKNNVIQAYEQLCLDTTPMVRRAAAKSLKAMLQCCSAKVASDRLKPLFLHFMKDEQDSVRLLGVGLLPELAKSLPASQHASVIGFNVDQAATDDSWRVRYMLVDVIVDLQKALSSELADKKLLPRFAELLTDAEPEIRTCAATKVHDFCLGIGTADRCGKILEDVLPPVRNLVADSSEHCRAAIATVIMGLSSILGKDDTIEHLLPFFLKLLKDDFSQVRLNVISKLEEVNAVIGLEHLTQALLPAIEELAQNEEWRTRLAIIEYIPVVSRQLGVDFFNKNLLNFATTIWLRDPVFAVRKAAIENLKALVDAFGSDWAEEIVIPCMAKMATEEHFVHRLTTLFALNALLPVCSEETCTSKILPILAPLAEDKIPNIRMNVAKTLATALDKTSDSSAVDSIIRPTLNALAKDKDTDVKDFALAAFQKLESEV